MGAGANNGNSKRVEIRMTPELANHLDGLAKLGLYGGTVSEVIRHLVKVEVRRLTRNSEIEKWLADKDRLAGLSE